MIKKNELISHKIAKLEKINKNELFGGLFGGNKKKEKLSWDKESSIAKRDLEKQSTKVDVKWSNNGKAKIDNMFKCVSMSSKAGTMIQYDEGGKVTVEGRDVDKKVFKCPIEGGKVSGLKDAFDYFVKADKAQGKSNISRNKMFLGENAITESEENNLKKNCTDNNMTTTTITESSTRRHRNIKRITEAKKEVDPHDFDMCLMSLGNLIEDLDYVCHNKPEVPRYVWKCLDVAETLSDGINYILKSNKDDLSKTIKDKRMSDLRPTFALFLINAENIRKEMDHPDGDYWSRAYELRHFKEYLDEISSVLNNVL